MDLTEVEGIRDLVEADTEAQRKLAARQAGVSSLRCAHCVEYRMLTDDFDPRDK